jgi:hypothetical protein
MECLLPHQEPSTFPGQVQDVSRAEAVGLLGEKYRMAEDEAQAAIDAAEESGWISLGRPR